VLDPDAVFALALLALLLFMSDDVLPVVDALD
jgi:hypothetical protein